VLCGVWSCQAYSLLVNGRASAKVLPKKLSSMRGFRAVLARAREGPHRITLFLLSLHKNTSKSHGGW